MTKEEKELARWEAILEAEGLGTIEKDNVIQPQIIRKHNTHANSPAYYELVARMIDMHNFKKPINKRILELHQKGLSLRQIESKLREEQPTEAVSHVRVKAIVEEEIAAFHKFRG